MFTNLLVPWDGTPESAVALAPALTMAKHTGATLTVIRVVPREEISRTDGELAEARDGIARVAAELSSTGVVVDTAVRTGEPGREIVGEAYRRGADLIVMATHGRSGLGRAILGSVAQRVVTHSPIPVMLVRPGGHRLTGISTLLVPVDGSPGGTVALGAAVALARSTGAKIALIEVIIPAAKYAVADPTFAAPAMYFDPAWDEEARQAAQSYLDGLVARLQHAGVTAAGRATIGEVVDSIDEEAERVSADLIVMSTHALTGPARALLGSVADEVVRTARRPVLLIRRDVPIAEKPVREAAPAKSVTAI